MRERRSLPISSEVALKSEKDGTGKLAVNSVICGVVDELSNGRTGRRGSWVRHAVMGVLRWKDLTGVRTSTPTEQKEVGTLNVGELHFFFCYTGWLICLLLLPKTN